MESKLTFADIDKTAIGGASPITLELIKCKQAISRAVSFVDLLRNEQGYAGTAPMVEEVIKADDTLQEGLNRIISAQIELTLFNTDFKQI